MFLSAVVRESRLECAALNEFKFTGMNRGDTEPAYNSTISMFRYFQDLRMSAQ